MPSFKLDGKEIPFQPGESIIRAAYNEGIEIPHYCWHPGLSAPANCRMCLVEILPAPNQRAVMLDILEWDAAANDYRPVRKPKLQPACQMPAVDGQEIKADSSTHVQDARKAVQESLLLNHPVDCPICDQSGECRLQDYWLEYQKTPKRMRDEPVHKPKAEVFGDTIVYDGERCVMCTRCIRFMEEVAHDPVLGMRERGNLNEIFVAPGRKLEGHYTFMTEHVCPVGALTTKDFRFKARVWFLRTAKSVCQGCATGCNAYLDFDARNNKVYRYRPRDNEAVNAYWMCDEGMLSYKRAHDDRLLEAKLSGRVAGQAAVLEATRKLFDGVARESIAVVLSAQHSLEDNWAMLELARTSLGTKNIYFSKDVDGYEDKILIHKDKSSNTRGVQELAPEAKPFEALMADVGAVRTTHVIALGSATPRPKSDEDGSAEDLIGLKGLRALVTIATNAGPLADAAHVLLPAASWAEASGTYVNAKGVKQTSEKGIDLLGSALPAWEQVAHVARALGYEPTWSKLKDIRARLGLGPAGTGVRPASANEPTGPTHVGTTLD
jgi:NADH-quinone oxidoreductase subunit G